jgi:hypothetical protein
MESLKVCAITMNLGSLGQTGPDYMTIASISTMHNWVMKKESPLDGFSGLTPHSVSVMTLRKG